MSRVKGKDTRQEVEIRKRLFALGFRYRLHDKKLPGTPDIVLPKYKAVVFIHGCFWHVHDCDLFKWPSSKKAFWKTKLKENRKRDIANISSLQELGWRVLVIWECAYRGVGKKYDIEFDKLARNAAKWLRSSLRTLEIRGMT